MDSDQYSMDADRSFAVLAGGATRPPAAAASASAESLLMRHRLNAACQARCKRPSQCHTLRAMSTSAHALSVEYREQARQRRALASECIELQLRIDEEKCSMFCHTFATPP